MHEFSRAAGDGLNVKEMLKWKFRNVNAKSIREELFLFSEPDTKVRRPDFVSSPL